ncbi:MAG TPA: heat-inducible transcriptional repressor HrcA [Fimbriimonadaceae bacterium]|nr:heat-inducible transcriptional repressor HrcA [Fimbriimonadaceae bacterium]HRJ33374.1 heat-inducible transcriptional repressor HrcA [Fimbriimonadaceae bacterium]
MEALEQRKEAILRAVIVEYVRWAEPVGSETIALNYSGLGVRSATVRNELAEMAELGLLEKPHASAGRIPSDQGYRYFVDHLIQLAPPRDTDQERVRLVTQQDDVLKALLQETTKALSRLTHLLSAATTIREGSVRIRHAMLSAMGPERALLVVVLANGHVENRTVDCPPGLSLEEVGQANALLAATLAEKPIRSVSRLKTPSAGQPALDRFLASAMSQVRAMAREWTQGHLILEGEEYILNQPEFRRSDEVAAEILQSLEDDQALLEALSEPSEGPETVSIGSENRQANLRPLTILRHTFFVGPEEAGTLAIIGPRRMNYEGSIPLLRFAAQALSETLTKNYV